MKDEWGTGQNRKQKIENRNGATSGRRAEDGSGLAELTGDTLLQGRVAVFILR